MLWLYAFGAVIVYIPVAYTHRIDVEEKLDEVGSLCTERERNP